MTKTNIRLFMVLIGLLLGGPLAAAPKLMPNPDFTKGESIPEGAVHDWTLGATGARGWMYSNQLGTTMARQVAITEVAEGAPADGILKLGDVLLGVAGSSFSYDPRTELGKALTAAEAVDGRLVLTRWRDGKTEQVTIELPVLGSYSPTAPYDCPKSERILEAGCKILAEKMSVPKYEQNAIPLSLNGLALLASGDPKYYPILKRHAEWAANVTNGGTWRYAYLSIFLAEYVMATGDKSVLPGLRRIALEVAKGQSKAGSWGHKFAKPDGRLHGYGMMNSPGLVLTIGMTLAREVGGDDPEVAAAIERSAKLLRFYIGKGAIAYGDHSPFMQSHENNGTSGMAAVLLDLLGEQEGARFFAKMSAASHGRERDEGHTGNFFNIAWAMPGVVRCGPHATGAWMEEFGSWYFDLARGWDGTFRHQGGPTTRGDCYRDWDATGVYLIAYAMPRKAIRLTGKKPFTAASLDAEAARQVVRDGRGFETYSRFTAYDDLPPNSLLELLGHWSPIVRERVSSTISRRRDIPVESLIQMLDARTLEARLGACSVLAAFGKRATPAVPKLLETLDSDHMWLRVQAARALAAIGGPAVEAAPRLLRVVAEGPTKEDPRAMEQRYLVGVLFNRRGALLSNSVEGVDKELLIAAVRSALHNQDGQTRGCASMIYDRLTLSEMKPLMPAIYESIIKPSPSGIMFDGQAQLAGLKLLSQNRISEGIELIADYTRLQKPHGSENRIKEILEMLKPYGAHAKRAIPILEKSIYYFENEEDDFPRALGLQKAEACRQTIREILTWTEEPELRALDL